MSRRIIIESGWCQDCGSRGYVSCRTFPCEHGGHPCESCTGRGVLEHSLTAPSPGMVERAAKARYECERFHYQRTKSPVQYDWPPWDELGDFGQRSQVEFMKPALTAALFGEEEE